MSDTGGRAIGRATALEGRPPTGYRILVVDDDEAVRRLVARVLRAAGHEVVTMNDGRAALRTALGDSAQFDLLLTDVEMPGMSGIELARELRAKDPELRVLMISGYTEEAVGKVGPDGIDLLGKPFSADDLIGRVRAVLTSPASRA
jgi:DNA-binding response OmpR family regulator